METKMSILFVIAAILSSLILFGIILILFPFVPGTRYQSIDQSFDRPAETIQDPAEPYPTIYDRLPPTMTPNEAAQASYQQQRDSELARSAEVRWYEMELQAIASHNTLQDRLHDGGSKR
jgi:hypothetical protein